MRNSTFPLLSNGSTNVARLTVCSVLFAVLVSFDILMPSYFSWTLGPSAERSFDEKAAFTRYFRTDVPCMLQLYALSKGARFSCRLIGPIPTAATQVGGSTHFYESLCLMQKQTLAEWRQNPALFSNADCSPSHPGQTRRI